MDTEATDPDRSSGHGAERVPPPTLASSALLPREVAVLQLAAQGLTPHSIAIMLHLPERAVEELQRRCAWRLGAADLRAAIDVARRQRLIG